MKESIPSLWPPVLGHCGMRIRTEVRCVVCEVWRRRTEVRAWVCGCAWEKRRKQRAEGRDDEGTERRGILCVAWVAGWIGVIGGR